MVAQEQLEHATVEEAATAEESIEEREKC